MSPRETLRPLPAPAQVRLRSNSLQSGCPFPSSSVPFPSPSPVPSLPCHPIPIPKALSWGLLYPDPSPTPSPSPRILAPQPQGLRLREPRCASFQSLWASLPSLPSVSSSQAPTSFRMTLDVGPEDELPDWAAAKEFYQKYDPKDVIGR